VYAADREQHTMFALTADETPVRPYLEIERLIRRELAIDFRLNNVFDCF